MSNNDSRIAQQTSGMRYLLYHTLGILDNQINYSDEFYLYKFSADICAESLKNSSAEDSAENNNEKPRAGLYKKIDADKYQKLIEKSRVYRKINKCSGDTEDTNKRRHSLVYDLSGNHNREMLVGITSTNIAALNRLVNLEVTDTKKLLNIYSGSIPISSIARYIETGRALTSPYFFNFVDIDIVIDSGFVSESPEVIQHIVLLLYVFIRLHCYSATLICGNSRVSELVQAEIAGLEKRGYSIKNNEHMVNKYILRLDPQL